MPAASCKTLLISASDAGYFQFLQGLLSSIAKHRPSHAQLDIGIIDIGLGPTQVEELRGQCVQVVPGRWNLQFPAQGTAPRWFQAQVSRPFLPDYFPGYDLYIWLDADTWLQDWRVMELLTAAFPDSSDEIAIVPEVHWAYPSAYGVGPYRELMFGHVKGSFGEQAARFLDGRATFNSGVLSIPATSSVWDRWREHLHQGLQNIPNKWTEQTALNLALYNTPTSIRILPAWCNWVCWHALPGYDEARRCLCEPTRPFDKLSLIHLTSMNKPGLKLSRTEGGTIEIPLDHAGFHAAVEPAQR